MTGLGIVTVRLPPSLLNEFRAAAELANMSVHDAARRLICDLPTVTEDDMRSLKQAPRERVGQKVSLYLGSGASDALTSIAWAGRMSNSEALRRLLFALLIDKTLTYVQRGNGSELRFVQEKSQEKSVFNGEGA